MQQPAQGANMFNPNTIETTQLDDLLFTIVDVETTGSKPLFHHIIEIGIVQMRAGEILDTYQTFINPGTPVPPDITMITGITDQDIEHAPIFPDIAPNIMPYLSQGLFVAHNVQFDYNFLQKSLYRTGINWHAPKICTVQLSRRVLPHLPKHNLDALSQYFHIQIPNRHRALDDAIATTHALWQMCNILKSQGHNHVYAISKLSKTPESVKVKQLKSTLDSIPYTPGVYLMKNHDQQIIYIGKSKCLHKRVRSYFYEGLDKSKKIHRLVEEVQSIDYIQTGSELSALLLESQLIKKHLPVFNRMIRNFQNYPFLKITNESFPRLVISREIKPDQGIYYGPFKTTMEVSTLITQLQKTFGIRTCKAKLNPKKTTSFKTCLDVALGNCSGACTGKLAISEYQSYIKRAQNFLDGNAHQLIQKIEHQIDNAAQKLEYETAAELRDKLITLERLHNNRARIAQAVHQNNLVILQAGPQTNTKEAFFVRSGILKVQFILIPNHAQTITQETENFELWYQFLSQVYLDQNISSVELSKSNLDELMIIATWLMHHPQGKNLHYLNSEQSLATVARLLAQDYLFPIDSLTLSVPHTTQSSHQTQSSALQLSLI